MHAIQIADAVRIGHERDRLPSAEICGLSVLTLEERRDRRDAFVARSRRASRSGPGSSVVEVGAEAFGDEHEARRRA